MLVVLSASPTNAASVAACSDAIGNRLHTFLISNGSAHGAHAARGLNTVIGHETHSKVLAQYGMWLPFSTPNKQKAVALCCTTLFIVQKS